MLASLWQTGEKETADALSSGKRFILHIDSGRVDGRDVTSLAETESEAPSPLGDTTQETVPIADALPQEVEAPPADTGEIPPIKQSDTPIAAVDDKLVERKDKLMLPRVTDGVFPWVQYSRFFKRQDERPLVAIIVTGLGHNRQVTQAAMALNENVALSFSPYARSIAGWVDASRMAGHETYIDLPMQAAGYPDEDEGPYSLLLSRSNTQNINYLFWAMSRVQGYAGLFTAVNTIMTSNPDAFKPVVKEIAKRGVMLLMGHEPLMRETRDIIDESKVSKLIADVWVDEELTEMGIQARLATLEQTARRNGFAVGVVHAYPISIAQIKYWQEHLEEHEVVLAPPSFLVKLRN